MVGPKGSGKTSILKSLMNEESDNKHRSTFGLDFRVRDISVNNRTCRLQIIDTSSKEELSVNCDYYLRVADALMYIYDISKPRADFEEFYDKFEDKLKKVEEAKSDTPFKPKFTVLVGNKSDLQRKVQFLEGQSMKDEKKMRLFFEVSAKDGKYIEGLFESTASQYFANLKRGGKESNKDGRDYSDDEQKQRKHCICF